MAPTKPLPLEKNGERGCMIVGTDLNARLAVNIILALLAPCALSWLNPTWLATPSWSLSTICLLPCAIPLPASQYAVSKWASIVNLCALDSDMKHGTMEQDWRLKWTFFSTAWSLGRVIQYLWLEWSRQEILQLPSQLAPHNSSYAPATDNLLVSISASSPSTSLHHWYTF